MVAPFVQEAARALHEAGQLDRFITSIRHDPDSCAQTAACALAGSVGWDLTKQLGRRAVSGLPPEKIEMHPWGELARLLTARIDRDGRATDFVWERAEKAFDRRVAGGLSRSLTGLYSYEYCSLASITRANALGIRVAYDMPAPEPAFVQDILDRETAAFPELITAWHRWTAAREAGRIARRREEYQRADVVISASSFTRESFRRAGLDTAKVRVVPYGAPPVMDCGSMRSVDPKSDGGPLHLVWAGSFSVRKGAHYLLEAWRKHHLGRHARLEVYGSVGLPERVLKPDPEGVVWRGSVPREEWMQSLQRADALIFPTLCDGFGMVVTEAWSRGVPVITTSAAGAAERLRHGENGLLMEAGSPDAIAEAVGWCCQNRAALHAMRESCLETAASWQWKDYRRALSAELEKAGLYSHA